MRLHSGVGTMSKEIAIGSVNEFDWVQIGGAINHPDAGKVFDVSNDVNKELGMLKLIPLYSYFRLILLNLLFLNQLFQQDY